MPNQKPSNQKELEFAPTAPKVEALISVEQQRAIQEVQAQMVIAKRFPRDPDACLIKIKKACRRKSLALVAQYAYPRGDSQISGPSIRIMEVIGQNWNNLNFGIAELSQDAGYSDVEAYAWDLETNVRMSKTFKVSHTRKAHGRIVTLNDPRDIYEHVANQGARRMRACLMGVIPRDIVDAAIAECEKTLQTDEKPLEDRIREMLDAFDKLAVSKAMIEQYLGHATKAILPSEIVHLISVHNAIRDGIATREVYFAVPRTERETVSDLSGEIDDAETGSQPPPPEAKKPEAKTKSKNDRFKPKIPDVGAVYDMSKWYKKGKKTFEPWIKKYLSEMASWPEDIYFELIAKWERLYPNKKFPAFKGSESGNTGQHKKAEPGLNKGDSQADIILASGDRMEIWLLIKKVFAGRQIMRAQSDLGFAIGYTTPPSTAEGCAKLYNHLIEKYQE